MRYLKTLLVVLALAAAVPSTAAAAMPLSQARHRDTTAERRWFPDLHMSVGRCWYVRHRSGVRCWTHGWQVDWDATHTMRFLILVGWKDAVRGNHVYLAVPPL